MNTKPQDPKPARISVRVMARIMAWKFFFDGTFSLRHVLVLMLPGRLQARQNIPLRLFGKPFVLPEGDRNADFFNLTSQIIASDNYHVALAKGVVIDAGANMGVFSVYAAARHPDATIYAFEPAPKTFQALKENTKHYPNIVVTNCGLGEREGSMPFVIGEHSGENFVGAGGDASVTIKTIDSLNLPVSFIKMDTEGYEGNILRGAEETIRRSKPIVIMSAYHKPGDRTELPNIMNAIAPYDCEFRADCEEDFICRPLESSSSAGNVQASGTD